MRPQQTAPPQPERGAQSRVALASDPAGSLELTLPAALDAPAMARAAVSAWMSGHVGETLLADAQLVVAELVANSVRHAETPDGAPVRVRAVIRYDAVHLEVEDRGVSGSIVARAPDVQRGGGFGLNVVQALSRRWGVDRDTGTRVWAEIAIPAVACDPPGRGPAAPPNSNGHARRAAASAAQTRADDARRRAIAARHAANRAGTEYARGAHHRVAELHAAIARHHERSARTLHLGDRDSNPDAA